MGNSNWLQMALSSWLPLNPALMLSLIVLVISIYFLFSRGSWTKKDIPKQSKRIPENLLGIRTLYPPPNYSENDLDLDIIAVHGLGANPATTWTAAVDKDKQLLQETRENWGFHDWLFKKPAKKNVNYVNWLSDTHMLPALWPKARIMVYNHETQWYGDAVQMRLDNLATDFVRLIKEARKDCPERPLIFIGHSLGGLIIEKALIHHDAVINVVPAVTAVVLFGTPHTGTEHIGFREIVERIIKTGAHVELGLLNSLRPDNEDILNTVNTFSTMANGHGISIDCFFETKGAVVAKMFAKDTEKAVIVDEKSATLRSWPSYPLSLDHYTLNKFGDPESGNWRAVKTILLQRCGQASAKMQARKGDSDWIPPFNVPYERDLNFVGREPILSKIEELQETSSRVALHGIGGVGKSQIAIEYAYRFREKNPRSCVFWVFAGTIEKFEHTFKEIAQVLELPGASDPKVDTLAIVTKWLNTESSRNSWLLILDNLDDIDIFYRNTESPNRAQHSRSSSTTQASTTTRRFLNDYLPRTSRGAMLVTSRVKHAATKLVENRVVSIPTMSPTEAFQLLQVRLPPSFKGREQHACIQLVQDLDCLPLAITQASAFIGNNEQMTIACYLNLFNEQANQSELLETEYGGDIRREKDVPSCVTKTWLISFDQLARKEGIAGEAAIRLLYKMSFFDRNSIPGSLLCDNINRMSFQTAIGKLLAYCLVIMEKEKSSYGMHRLVQIVTRNKVALENQTSQWKKDALRALEHLFPSGEIKTWKRCEELLPHFQAVKGYKLADESSEEARASLLSKKAYYDEQNGMWEAMRFGCEEELAIRLGLTSLGTEHPSSLKALHKLAWANYNLGDIDVAKQRTEQALKSRRRVLGSEHADTLRTLNNLAIITADEILSMEALQGLQRTLGDHEHTVESLSNHAFILNAKGENEYALEFNEEALAMMGRLYPPKHPDILECLMVRFTILCDMERFEEAEKLAKEVLEIRVAVLGDSHIDTILSLHDCAHACSYIEDYSNAEKYAVRCLEASYKHAGLGPKAPYTLGVMKNLGNFQQMQSKFANAQETYETALSTAVEVYGEEGEETWPHRISLGSLHIMLGHEDSAITVLECFLRTVNAKGIRDEDLLDDAADLARSFQKLKRLAEAELVWETVMIACKKSSSRGPGHYSTVRAANNFGSVLQERRKFSEAESLFRVEYESRIETLGPAHEYSLGACRALMEVLKQQGRLSEVDNIRQEESWLFKTKEAELEKRVGLLNHAQSLYQAEKYREAKNVAYELLSLISGTNEQEDDFEIGVRDLLDKIRLHYDTSCEGEDLCIY